MAIQLMSAILARESYDDLQGHKHIVDPATPITIPAALRERMEKAGAAFLSFDFPPIVGVVTLWGGIRGENYILSGAIEYPDGSAAKSGVSHFTWPELSATIVVIDFSGVLGFKGSGTYKFKFLLNGKGMAVLPLPILWEDELPR